LEISNIRKELKKKNKFAEENNKNQRDLIYYKYKNYLNGKPSLSKKNIINIDISNLNDELELEVFGLSLLLNNQYKNNNTFVIEEMPNLLINNKHLFDLIMKINKHNNILISSQNEIKFENEENNLFDIKINLKIEEINKQKENKRIATITALNEVNRKEEKIDFKLTNFEKSLYETSTVATKIKEIINWLTGNEIKTSMLYMEFFLNKEELNSYRFVSYNEEIHSYSHFGKTTLETLNRLFLHHNNSLLKIKEIELKLENNEYGKMIIDFLLFEIMRKNQSINVRSLLELDKNYLKTT
jgi:hypothetical protein